VRQILLVLSLVIANIALPEEVKLKKIKLFFGNSAIDAGPQLGLHFDTGEKRELGFIGSPTMFYANHGWKVNKKLTLSLTGGFYENTPWAGPLVTVFPIKKLTIMYWPGWSAGRAGKPEFKVYTFYHFLGTYFDVTKNISVGYSMLKFQTDRVRHMPEIFYKHPLGSKFKWAAGVAYDSLVNKPYFNAAISYYPK
jgi:hypothetical protein